jgi:hypothetical protein
VNAFSGGCEDALLPFDSTEFTKECPDCHELKSAADFRRNAARPDGLAFYCKECARRRDAASYRARRLAAGHSVREGIELPEGHLRCSLCETIKTIAEFDRAPYQSNGRSSWCKPCKAKRQRQSRFQRLYGMSEHAVEGLIADQGGVCAICQYRTAEHVDHDHVTGEVRGVLCFPCNAALGHFKDRIDLLDRAAGYLRTATWQKPRVCNGVHRLSAPRAPVRPMASSSALSSLIASRRSSLPSRGQGDRSPAH